LSKLSLSVGKNKLESIFCTGFKKIFTNFLLLSPREILENLINRRGDTESVDAVSSLRLLEISFGSRWKEE
jgi:hypothetical protein